MHTLTSEVKVHTANCELVAVRNWSVLDIGGDRQEVFEIFDHI